MITKKQTSHLKNLVEGKVKPNYFQDLDRTLQMGLRGAFLRILHTILLAATFAVPAIASDARLSLNSLNSEDHFFASTPLPLSRTKNTSRAEDEDLLRVLNIYQKNLEENKSREEQILPLEHFIKTHPHSGWGLSIHSILGKEYFNNAYFSRAISHLTAASITPIHVNNNITEKLKANAIGELLQVHARLGHKDSVRALLSQNKTRSFSGTATELVAEAQEYLLIADQNPSEVALCGINALANMLDSNAYKFRALKSNTASNPSEKGYNISELLTTARQSGYVVQAVRTTFGANIPVPSVVHWRQGHYAAVVAEKDGSYLVKDQVFDSGERWVPKKAIEAEASGYFIVKSDYTIDSKTTIVASHDELSNIYGAGYTYTSQKGATKPEDIGVQSSDDCGMCTVGAKAMLVSLNISDTPVGYQPALGPDAHITLTYNQREAGHPPVYRTSNFGPKWSFNMMSWVEESLGAAANTTPAFSVRRIIPGGGYIDYSEPYGYTYNTTTGEFSPEKQTGAVLTRVPSQGPLNYYELSFPDGSKMRYAGKEIYNTAVASQTTQTILLSTITDKTKNSLFIKYTPVGQAISGVDAKARIQSITDESGGVTSFSYGSLDPLQIISISDPFSRKANFSYDVQGQLVKITDAIGMASQFYYGGQNLIKSVTTPYGTTTIEYDNNHPETYPDPVNFDYNKCTSEPKLLRSLQITDPLGKVQRFESPTCVSLSQEPWPSNRGCAALVNCYLNFRNTLYWDRRDASRMNNRIPEEAYIFHWLHSANNGAGRPEKSFILESFKKPGENRDWFEYEGAGLFVDEGKWSKPKAIRRVVGNGLERVWMYSYNSLGEVNSITDPIGRITRTNYLPNGKSIQSIEQLSGPGTYSQLNAFTYNNGTTASQYLPSTVETETGAILDYTYNANGQVLSVANGATTLRSMRYDPVGRLIESWLSNQKTSFEYDAFNRISAVIDSEAYKTRYSYDLLDRLTKITYPDNTSFTIVYKFKDIVKTIDRSGRQTIFTYDANRKLKTIIKPGGGVVKYTRTPNGSIESMTDPMGNVTVYARDVQERIARVTYPGGNARKFSYSGSTGLLSSVADAEGQITWYNYNIDDTLTSISYSNEKNPTSPADFTYDPYFRRLTSMKDWLGMTTWEYIPFGKILVSNIVENGPFGQHGRVQTELDQFGRVIGYGSFGGSEALRYDNISRVETRQINPVGGQQLIFLNSYLGNSTQITEIKDITGQGASNSFTTTYQYESNVKDRRLKGISNAFVNRTVSYASDVLGRTTASDSVVPGAIRNLERFSYTQAGELEARQSDLFILNSSGAVSSQARTVDSFKYDLTSNVLSASYNKNLSLFKYNMDGQLTSSSNKTGSQTIYSYDKIGNLLEDANHLYKWDAMDRLIEIAYKADSKRKTQLSYDGLGRRRVTVDAIGNQSETTQYHWCGNAICGESKYQAPGNTFRWISHFSQGTSESGNFTFLLKDYKGTLLSSKSVGSQAVDHYDYTAYGVPTGQKLDSGYAFSGLFYHSMSGLFFANNRVYSPTAMRWLSRDPLGSSGFESEYNYAGADPVNRIDPLGLADVNGYTACDGNGNIAYWIIGASGQPFEQCTIAHEKQHVADMQEMFGATACAGRPQGYSPFWSLMSQGDTDAAQRYSECKAHTISNACAEQILRNTKKSSPSYPSVKKYCDSSRAQKAAFCSGPPPGFGGMCSRYGSYCPPGWQ